MADLQYLQILNQEGYNWDDFLNWVDTELVESMLYVHIEIQNTENHIKRLRSHFLFASCFDFFDKLSSIKVLTWSHGHHQRLGSSEQTSGKM